jgi:para-nitrobenzyl esterase
MAVDRWLSARLQGYWTAFARTGDPNDDGFSTWPRFEARGVTTMVLGDQAGPAEIPHLATMRFFDDWMSSAP